MRFNPQLKISKHRRLYDYLDGKIIFPINIEVSLTGRCNADCSFCFYKGKRSSVDTDPGRIVSFLCEGAELDLRAVTWTGGGEPTLHPNFEEITSYVSVKQGLITNGLAKIAYNPEKFEWIRVSKTNKPWNIDNLKRLRECKTVGLCISTNENPDDAVREALDIAYELDLDYVQVRPALNRGSMETFAQPTLIEASKLVSSEYKYEEAEKERSYTKCEGFHFVPFVWEDGRVDVCAYRRGEAEYNLGDIRLDSYRDIFLCSPSSVCADDKCQRCCKNHELNKTIAEMKKLQDEDFV